METDRAGAFSVPDNSCPLCACTEARPDSRLDYGEIWSGLVRDWGAFFTPTTIARHTPERTTELVSCNDCGLQYFRPAICGDESFYKELTESSEHYYLPEKWDFEVVADRLLPSARVLDVACGEGAFLRRIETRVERAVGVDTNPDAVVRARAAGLDVYEQTIEDFSKEHAEAFDWVCLFQVIEHLPDIRPFVQSALACVAPGGRLVVSVPNRERLKMSEFEPLDCPPHHLSRWGVEQLEYLSRMVEAVQVERVCEPAERSPLMLRLRERTARPAGAFGDVVGRLLARAVFAQPLYQFYVRSGILERLGYVGHSLVAVLTKAERSGV